MFKVIQHGTYAQLLKGVERRLYSDHGLNDSFNHLRYAFAKNPASIVLKPFIARWVNDPKIRNTKTTDRISGDTLETLQIQ